MHGGCESGHSLCQWFFPRHCWHSRFLYMTRHLSVTEADLNAPQLGVVWLWGLLLWKHHPHCQSESACPWGFLGVDLGLGGGLLWGVVRLGVASRPLVGFEEFG